LGKALEVFGRPPEGEPETHWCPFLKDTCRKQARGVEDGPFGVCSVKVSSTTPVVICPWRFPPQTYEKDIIDLWGKATVAGNVRRLEQYRPPGISRSFDLVLAEVSDSTVLDFALAEVQACDTTGTGDLVMAYKDWPTKGYLREANFGINWLNAIKRLSEQLLYKAGLAQYWSVRLYVVLQDVLFERFWNQYGFSDANGVQDGNVVFLSYKLDDGSDKTPYEMILVKVFCTDAGRLAGRMTSVPAGAPDRDRVRRDLTDRLRG
jgi:hypothetical protein